MRNERKEINERLNNAGNIVRGRGERETKEKKSRKIVEEGHKTKTEEKIKKIIKKLRKTKQNKVEIKQRRRGKE